MYYTRALPHNGSLVRWPPSRLAETALASAIFLIISILAARGQQVERVFGDAKVYHDVSQQLFYGAPRVEGEPPFAYRIATPWLASVFNAPLASITPPWFDQLIDYETGRDDVHPWYAVNIAASFVTLLLLVVYLRCFIASAGLRLLLVTAWMIQWHVPIRFVYFNPVNVEPLFLAFIVAALLAMEKFRDRSTLWASLVMTVLVFAGTLTRESMFLAAIAFVASRHPLAIYRERRWTDGALLLLPAFACVGALAYTRHAVVAVKDVQPWTEPLRMLRTKPIDTFLLAWFFTFGPPMLALIAAARRHIGGFLRQEPHVAVWLAGSALLAFFGGTDTERILGWAAPVMYVIGGRAINHSRHVLTRTPALVLLLLVVQVASARVVWPIPVGEDQVPTFATLTLSWKSVVAMLDKILVIENYYSNLWSYYGSRPLHLMILVFDVCLVIGVVFVIRRRPAALEPGARA